MDIGKLSEDTLQALRESAWFAGRQKDISYACELLSQDNFAQPNECIAAYLAEFLYVAVEKMTSDGYTITVHIDVEEAIAIIPLELISQLEQHIGAKLVPVGYFNEYAAALLMSYTGAFYMVDEDSVFLIAEDWETALVVILEQRGIQQIFSF